MSNSDNSQKNKRGKEFKKLVKQQLESLDEIKTVQKRLFKYSNKSQEFSFDFDVCLSNEEHWLIQCQTCLGDITQKHEWRALNIQKIQNMTDAMRERISRYYVVFEDTAEHGSYSLAHKHKAGEIESVIDGYLPVREMIETIQEYVFETDARSSGALYALRGLKKETYIINVLENEANRRRYFGGENLAGLDFFVYSKILSKLGFTGDEEVVCLKASNDKKKIGKLRGANNRPVNAKTDVVLTVKMKDETECTYTFSLKRSSEARKDISVYQTSVEHLSKCLRIEDAKLTQAMQHFQECGSATELEEKYPGDAEAIKRRIKPYISSLEKCAFSGRGIACVGEELNQYADYLIILGKSEVLINTIDEYIQLLHDMDVDRMFGTIFTWSYQGKRGKNIQFNTASLVARSETKK